VQKKSRARNWGKEIRGIIVNLFRFWAVIRPDGEEKLILPRFLSKVPNLSSPKPWKRFSSIIFLLTCCFCCHAVKGMIR
jgi:hypothetical protein